MHIPNPFKNWGKVKSIDTKSVEQISTLFDSTLYYVREYQNRNIPLAKVPEGNRIFGGGKDYIELTPRSVNFVFVAYKGYSDPVGKVYRHAFTLGGFDQNLGRKYIRTIDIDELSDQTAMTMTIQSPEPDILITSRMTFSTSSGEIIEEPTVDEVTLNGLKRFEVLPENTEAADLLFHEFQSNYENYISDFEAEFAI